MTLFRQFFTVETLICRQERYLKLILQCSLMQGSGLPWPGGFGGAQRKEGGSGVPGEKTWLQGDLNHVVTRRALHFGGTSSGLQARWPGR